MIYVQLKHKLLIQNVRTESVTESELVPGESFVLVKHIRYNSTDSVPSERGYRIHPSIAD